MGTAVRPAKTSPGPWDAFADVDVFVDEVLAELAAMAMDGARPMRSGPKPPLAGAALRKAVMAIWCVCFCGMQWRAIGLLCDIPFGTLYGLFARWTRLGLWRRLLNRLRRTWRLACGDTPEPSAVAIDSRSCRSAPSCFDRGIDGGKKIRGVKIHVGVEALSD
jgi:transposase